MRNFVILTMLLLSWPFLSFAQYQVTYVNHTSETITLRSIGYAKKAPLASSNAELAALKSLLFIGIPDSPYGTPMIQEEQSVIETNKSAFFGTFYESNFKNFISSSVIVVPFGKNKLKQKCITIDVTIKSLQLREYLEKNNVIRKFGL